MDGETEKRKPKTLFYKLLCSFVKRFFFRLDPDLFHCLADKFTFITDSIVPWPNYYCSTFIVLLNMILQKNERGEGVLRETFILQLKRIHRKHSLSHPLNISTMIFQLSCFIVQAKLYICILFPRVDEKLKCFLKQKSS